MTMRLIVYLVVFSHVFFAAAPAFSLPPSGPDLIIPDHISRAWDFSDDYSVFSNRYDGFLPDDIALQSCMPGKPSILGFHGPSFKGGAVVPFLKSNTRYTLLAACHTTVSGTFESAAVQLKRPVIGFAHEFINQAGDQGGNRGLICQMRDPTSLPGKPNYLAVPVDEWKMKAAIPCKGGRINVIDVKHPDRLFRNIYLKDGESGNVIFNDRTARSVQSLRPSRCANIAKKAAGTAASKALNMLPFDPVEAAVSRIMQRLPCGSPAMAGGLAMAADASLDTISNGFGEQNQAAVEWGRSGEHGAVPSFAVNPQGPDQQFLNDLASGQIKAIARRKTERYFGKPYSQITRAEIEELEWMAKAQKKGWITGFTYWMARGLGLTAQCR